MFKDLINKFSGAQLTMIILAAIFVPGAVTAAVTFTPVAIVDPITGTKSAVDAARRVLVFDPIAGYRNNPANIVEITVSNNGTQCETSQQYAVPAGRALVLTAASGYGALLSSSNSGYFVHDGAACTGNVITINRMPTSLTSTVSPVAVDFGAGIVVKAGKTVSVFSSNNVGYTFLHGYLVPAGAVPAVASADASAEPTPITAADVAAKMKLR